MKRMIFRRLGVVIVVAMLLVMALNYYFAGYRGPA